MPQFVKDVEEIRQRAIRKIEDGAVTDSYGVDKEHAIQILNEALATEIVCVLRYMHHYFMATGVHAKGVADEFKEHADSEREHADSIAERIQQLGGKPDMNPGTLVQRSVSQYIEGESLADMIREDLIAERVVIDVYTDMIRYFGDKDPVTRRMLEQILTDEEEHASDLSDLLYVVDPHTGKDRGQDPGTDPLSMERGRQQSGKRGNETRGREENEDMKDSDRRKSGKEQGISNRRSTEELQRGAVKSERGAGKSLNSSRERGGKQEQRSQDSRSQRDESEFRPARATGAERPAAGRGGDLETANTPGATGRPTRKRAPEIEDTAAGEVHAGAEGGTNRAVRVTNPNRKKKKVA
ncbi:MAG: ferritin-like domain-containing protein [Terriglobales bacterium]